MRGRGGEDPVEAFWAAFGGGEPDLLVRWLFVDYIGSFRRVGDGKDAGLFVESLA